MFAGMIITLVVVLREPSAPPVAATGPGKEPAGTGQTTTAGKEPATTSSGSKEPTTSNTPAPKDKPAPAETSPGTSKSKDSGDKPSHSSSSHSKESKSSAKETKEPKDNKPGKAPEEAPPPPAAKEKKDKPAKAKDDLDSLLDSASSGSGGKPKKEESDSNAPEQLSMGDVQKVLKGLNVSSCKDQGASGAVMVRLTISKNGSVSNASPQGGGAGGDCVAGKVKSAKFGKFTGDPMTLTFPFIVR
jgi:hypothetical protein